MGLFDIFKSKKIEPITVDPRNDQRKQMDQFLANFVSTYGPKYEPGKAYTGAFTAPLSKFENQGLDQFLAQYLNQDALTPQLSDVRSLLDKTVTGGFDPGTSDYYRALRSMAGYNRQQAIRDTNADLGARNKFFSSEAVSKYGDINAQTANSLNLAMADLADKERSRSMSAVPLLTSLENFLQNIPLQKAQAATTIGAIPRELAQKDLEAQYQDFKRQQTELGQVINATTGVSNTQTTQTAPAYKTSPFESFIGPLLGQFIGSDAGQGMLQSLGGAASAILAPMTGGLSSLLAFL